MVTSCMLGLYFSSFYLLCPVFFPLFPCWLTPTLCFPYRYDLVQVIGDVNDPTGDVEEVEDEAKNSFVPSSDVGGDGKTEDELAASLVKETANAVKDKAMQRSIPPPGTGQRIYEIDPLLNSYREHLDYR